MNEPSTSDALATLARQLPNGAAPLPGVLTAGQPTPAQLEALAGAGCRTVVDLRLPGEPRGYDEAAAVAALGMTYVELPVTYDGLGPDEFGRCRTLLTDRSLQPVLVHCASANRVGALLLPHLVLDHGHEREAAFELACAIGLRAAQLAHAAFQYLDEHAA